MADKTQKEFIVLKIDGNAGPKIEKLYNDGYRTYKPFANDDVTFVMFKLCTKCTE